MLGIRAHLIRHREPRASRILEIHARMLYKRLSKAEARRKEVGPTVRMKSSYNGTFLKFIKAFAQIGKDSRIFPKKCRACGAVYPSFPDYIHNTNPLGRGLEPYLEDLDVPRTLQYRNCICGSTLTVSFTKETYPRIESFWEMIGTESKRSGKPVREVVSEFRKQRNRYIQERDETAA